MSTSVIPFNIFQKYKDDNIVAVNPEFSFYYYDRDVTITLLSKYFPSSILDIFNNASDENAFQLWRLAMLWAHGGIYLDNGYQCVNGFKLTSLTDKEYFAKLDSRTIHSSIISCLAKNKIISHAILSFDNGKIRCHTAMESNLKFKFDNKYILLDNKSILRFNEKKSLHINYETHPCPPMPQINNNNLVNDRPIMCDEFNSLNTNFNFNSQNTFCISLENRNDRWTNFTYRANCLNFEVSRWKASTVNDVVDIFLDKLTPIEKACGQSHLNIWKHIVENNMNYAFILEDDALFDQHMFNKLLELSSIIKTHNVKWDAIFLNALSVMPLNLNVWRKSHMQYLCGGYILSYQGAKFMLDSYKDRYECSDHMTLLLQNQGNCYTYFPWLIIQQNLDSNIQNKTHLNYIDNLVKTQLELANYSLDNYNPVSLNPRNKTIIFIDCKSPYLGLPLGDVNHSTIKQKAIGASEYQLYNLIREFSKIGMNIICYNQTRSDQTIIDNVVYKHIDSLKSDTFSLSDVFIVQRSCYFIPPFNNKIFVWCHDYVSPELFIIPPLSFNESIQTIYNRKNINFVFNSKYTKDLYLNFINKSSRIRFEDNRYKLIYNILYEDDFSDFSNLHVNIDNYIVFASAWCKGIHKIIEIFRYIISVNNDIKLALLSPGYDYSNWENYRRQLLSEFGNRVIIYGPLDKHNYCRVIKSAICVLSPSFFETFGCVFAESYYLGTPVIADINSGAVKEIIGTDNIINYNNPELVYKKIIQFIHNRPVVQLNKKFLLDENLSIWKYILEF